MTTLLAQTGAYCSNHPNTSTCSGNSFAAELVGGIIIAILVFLAVLWLIWRYSDPDAARPSWPARIANRAAAALTRASKRD